MGLLGVEKSMKERFFFILALVILGVGQLLVVPIFSNQPLGGKVALFSFFVIILALCMVWQRREWILPLPLIPLVCLIVIFLVSLSRSTMPGVGIVEFGIFAAGVLFCVLVANLSYESDDFQKWVFKWLQIIGLIVAILCLYQYADWIVAGPKKETLIPFLLPPCYGRVNGVYGQPNLTALLLQLTIIASLPGYVPRTGLTRTCGGCRRDVAFFFVSTAFFLTGSRAGLLSLCVVLSILLWLTLRGKLRCSGRSLVKPLLILMLGFVFSLLPLSSEMATSSYARGEISIDARFLFWTASFLTFLDSPFWGVGLDHFKLFLPSYARKAHDVLGFVEYESMGYTNWSHNEYLQILAESGIVGFLFLTAFCLMLVRLMHKYFARKNPAIERVFLLLLLSPFFIQALFSWPFRYPALLFIFFLLLGIVLSKGSSYRFHVRPMAGSLIGLLLAASVLGIAFFSLKEYRFNQLKKQANENGCRSANIINSMNDPYLEFNMLREVLPLCISDESSLEDRALMGTLEPYFAKIANLQGTHSQWYNLGLVYRNLDEYAQAEHAFQKAVERQPEFELGWAALHVLHIEEAARQTGRPIEDFLPPDKKHSTDFYDSFFKRRQNLQSRAF